MDSLPKTDVSFAPTQAFQDAFGREESQQQTRMFSAPTWAQNLRVEKDKEEEEEQQQGTDKGTEEGTEEGRVATILTAENYRQQVEEELEKRGITVTDEIRENHIDPIAADLC